MKFDITPEQWTNFLLDLMDNKEISPKDMKKVLASVPKHTKVKDLIETLKKVSDEV